MNIDQVLVKMDFQKNADPKLQFLDPAIDNLWASFMTLKMTETTIYSLFGLKMW